MFSFSHAPPASRIFLGFLMAILTASVSYALFLSMANALIGHDTWFVLFSGGIFVIPATIVATSFVIVVYLPLYLVALAGRWTNVYYIVGWTFVVNSLIVFAPAFHSIWDAVLEGRGTTYRITDSCLAAIGAFVFWLIVHAEIPKLRKNIPSTPRIAAGLIAVILFAAVFKSALMALVLLGIYLPLYLLAVVYNRISFWWLAGSAFFINTLLFIVLETMKYIFNEGIDLLASYMQSLVTSVLVAAGAGVFWFVVYEFPFQDFLKKPEHF